MTKVNFDDLLKQGILCGKKMVPVYCTTDLSIFKPNPLNRALRPAKVAEFAHKLKTNTYKQEPFIVVLPDLTLADGHHRIAALKEFAAKIQEIPVWFMCVDDEEYLHNSNTGGSTWLRRNHVKYYSSKGKIHYVYLEHSTKEILDKQKEMHIAYAFKNAEIQDVLRGIMSPRQMKQVDNVRSNFDIETGDLKILIKKEYIIDILPYYKDLQTSPNYQKIVYLSNYRQGILSFLVIMYALGMDINEITTVLMNAKPKSQIFNPGEYKGAGGLKELLFRELGIRIKNKVIKQMTKLTGTDFSFILEPEVESPFYRITRAFHVLMKRKLFAPMGVYKQEELMNQQQ